MENITLEQFENLLDTAFDAKFDRIMSKIDKIEQKLSSTIEKIDQIEKQSITKLDDVVENLNTKI